jgi:putative phosphoesterase
MKLGLVSDIHCNIAGLERALELIGDVDELICAGDAIYQYRFSNDVVRLLREREARIVLGNHEGIFLGPHGVRARSAPQIDGDLVEWLAGQPWQIRTHVSGKTLVIAHGAPWEPYDEYLFPHSPSLSRISEADADIVILGHTHHQMAVRIGRTLVVNPGSAGEARDPRNNRQLTAAVLDTETEAVTFFDYPDPTHAPI